VRPARRGGSQGSSSSSAVAPSIRPHTAASGQRYSSGKIVSRYQSGASTAGALRRSADPWLASGASSASTSSIASSAKAIGRGGFVVAFGTRCTCTHISSSVTSGTPMWMNTSSENSRLLTWSGWMKLRISVPPKPGSQSSHSKLACVTNCASRSQGSM
jgi:hypothetical protein